MLKLVGKMCNHVIKSTKKLTEESTKKSLIYRILKRQLKLDLNQNKVFKIFVKKYQTTINIKLIV